MVQAIGNPSGKAGKVSPRRGVSSKLLFNPPTGRILSGGHNSQVNEVHEAFSNPGTAIALSGTIKIRMFANKALAGVLHLCHECHGKRGPVEAESVQGD